MGQFTESRGSPCKLIVNIVIKFYGQSDHKCSLTLLPIIEKKIRMRLQIKNWAVDSEAFIQMRS